MNEFDSFCYELLDQSKRFFEKSKEATTDEARRAFNNSSLLLAICALEAYVNGISDEICMAQGYPLQLKSALLERELRLVDGEYVLSNSLKMSRLVDRIEIIHRKYNKLPIANSEEWWKNLKEGIDCRNKIVHPKEAIFIDTELLERVIKAVDSCLVVLYKAVYKRKFPHSSGSIVSKLLF